MRLIIVATLLLLELAAKEVMISTTSNNWELFQAMLMES
jgi:hypothetical protein